MDKHLTLDSFLQFAMNDLEKAEQHYLNQEGNDLNEAPSASMVSQIVNYSKAFKVLKLPEGEFGMILN